MFPFPLVVLGEVAEVADSIYLESLIKPALVGVTYDIPQYTVIPEGTRVDNVTYTIELPNGSQISETGQYTPISVGSFSVTITAENHRGEILRSTSSAYAYQLSITLPEPIVYVVPRKSGAIGATILPTSARDLEGLKIAYTSTDNSVVQVTPSGRWYSYAQEGVCQIGCTVTYKNISVSATADFHVVTEAKSFRCKYGGQLVDTEGAAVLYTGGPVPEGLEVTALSIVEMTTLPTGWSKDFEINADSTFQIKVRTPTSGLYKFYVQGLNASGTLIAGPMIAIKTP